MSEIYQMLQCIQKIYVMYVCTSTECFSRSLHFLQGKLLKRNCRVNQTIYIYKQKRYGT